MLGARPDSYQNLRIQARFRHGGMAEWSMAVVLKTTVPGRVPGVRIPLPPPNLRGKTSIQQQERVKASVDVFVIVRFLSVSFLPALVGRLLQRFDARFCR